MPLNEANFTRLADNSIKLLDRFLNTPGEISEEQNTKVHVAATMVGSYVRFKQHQGNWAAVKVSLITRLTDNKEELSNYISVSLPELNLGKQPLIPSTTKSE